MKFLKLGVLLSTLSFCMASHGKVCQSGRLGDENYIKVNFGKNSTDFETHESSFSISAALQKSDSKKRYVIIPQQTVQIESEGEMLNSKVFSLTMFNGKNAIIYLNIDGTVLQDNTVLKCN